MDIGMALSAKSDGVFFKTVTVVSVDMMNIGNSPVLETNATSVMALCQDCVHHMFRPSYPFRHLLNSSFDSRIWLNRSRIPYSIPLAHALD